MTQRQIELRFAAADLANKDFLSLSDPFLVCHTLWRGRPAERIGRTETVKDDLNPVWTTTISFTHTPETAASSLLIDIFDRDSTSDTKLTSHDFLGRAVLHLDALLASPHLRLVLPLASATQPPARQNSLLNVSAWRSPQRRSTFSSRLGRSDLPQGLSAVSTISAATEDEDEQAYEGEDPADALVAPDLCRATTSSRASKNLRGELTVTAEFLCDTPGLPIVFRVSSALLKEAGPIFQRRVTQFYELQRERKVGDESVWSCVYRSRDGVSVDRNNYVIFDEMSITEQQLHNGQPARGLRLAFFKRNTRHRHELISYVNTSVAQLVTRKNQRNAVIPLEGEYGDQEGLGNVIVTHAQEVRLVDLQGDVERGEIQIHLRADHFLHKRFISSLNDAPKHVRKLKQLPAFITLH